MRVLRAATPKCVRERGSSRTALGAVSFLDLARVEQELEKITPQNSVEGV